MNQSNKKHCGIYIGYLPQLPLFFVIIISLFATQYLFYFYLLAYEINRYLYIIGMCSLPVFLFIFFNYIRCTLTDPGVIPRGNLSYGEANKKIKSIIQKQRYKYNPIQTYEMDEIIQDSIQTIEQQSASNNQEVQQQQKNLQLIDSFRYCNFCKQIKEPLASHCRKCNVCVKISDHHCVFVANCIGVRNHRSFLCFLFGFSILSMIYLICTLYQLIGNYQHFLDLSEVKGISQNQKIIMGVGIVFSFCILRLPRRCGQIRCILLVALIGIIYYLIKTLNIKLIFFSSSVAAIIIFTITIFTWPIIFPNLMVTLCSILRNKTQRQLNRSMQDQSESVVRLSNLIKFLRTTPPKSLI